MFALFTSVFRVAFLKDTLTAFDRPKNKAARIRPLIEFVHSGHKNPFVSACTLSVQQRGNRTQSKK